MTPDGVDEALARARGFVEASGGELARLRLAVLLGAAPAARLAGVVGWRPESGVAGALAALAALDGRHGLRGGEVERAVAWLADVQDADGGWSAASEPARVVVSGLLAGFLAKASCARPAQLDRAGAFLAASWGPERVQGGDFGMLAGYAHFFAHRPHELADGALQWCGRELERGFRARAFDAVRTALVFARCDAHALPGARIAPAELGEALLAEQAADGGFGLPVAPDAERVDATLDALVGLRHLRR